MILDERNEFCDSATVAYAAGNRLIGDVIDLGATPTLRDIGSGQPIFLVIQTDVAAAGAGNLTFDLRSDSEATVNDSPTTHFTTGAEAYTVWTAGRSVVVSLPQGVTYERYLGIWLTTSGTTTGGTVNVFLTCDPAKYTSYDNGI